jgi:hypothetical protein
VFRPSRSGAAQRYTSGMRRWRRWFIPVIGTATFALAVRYVYRTAHDSAQLGKYSQQLKPGLTRKEIKGYLQAHGTKFGERCCDRGFNAFAVIVKVDENFPPPFCSAWPVYVAFEFTVEPPYNLPIPVDADSLKKLQRKELEYFPGESDILTKVQLVSDGENCL